MGRYGTHTEAYVKPWAIFHGYVLGYVIGIRWGKITPTSGMGNSDLNAIVREYLVYAAGEDEWKKRCILDAIRDRSSSKIRDDARHNFPSLFPRGRRAKSLAVPEELSNEQVNFDLDRIYAWQEKAKSIKREISMNENAVQEAAESANAEGSTTGGGSNRVTVNFHVPPGVNAAELTLDNYREVTGKRYRMTKDQKERGLTREAAFAESQALALGGN